MNVLYCIVQGDLALEINDHNILTIEASMEEAVPDGTKLVKLMQRAYLLPDDLSLPVPSTVQHRTHRLLRLHRDDLGQGQARRCSGQLERCIEPANVSEPHAQGERPRWYPHPHLGADGQSWDVLGHDPERLVERRRTTQEYGGQGFRQSVR